MAAMKSSGRPIVATEGAQRPDKAIYRLDVMMAE